MLTLSDFLVVLYFFLIYASVCFTSFSSGERKLEDVCISNIPLVHLLYSDIHCGGRAFGTHSYAKSMVFVWHIEMGTPSIKVK